MRIAFGVRGEENNVATFDKLLESTTKPTLKTSIAVSCPSPPKRKVAVVTCMDARLHPEKFLGFELGDAHVIRNAGGKVTRRRAPLIGDFPADARHTRGHRHPAHGLRHDEHDG